MSDTELHEEDARYEEAGQERRRRTTDLALEGPVRQAMAHAPPPPLPATATVAEAAELMHDGGHPALVIVDGAGKLAGLLTARQIVARTPGADWNPGALHVGDIMLKNPMTLRAGDAVGHALSQIAAGGTHIPLVDEHGVPVGVVTVHDLLRYVADLLGPHIASYPAEPFRGATDIHGG